MSAYRFTVTVDAPSAEQAATVLAERLGFDEDYGFPYRIDYAPVSRAFKDLHIPTADQNGYAR